MNGIVNILKPPGMTSQNVVTYVKRILKADKAGHTGTLDPGASGVLPVCTGKATRISEYLLNDKKTYRAELEIGFKSDTLDKYGNLQKVYVPNITQNDIYDVFHSFRGKVEQMPPMFSAVKKDGKKLYELARQGIDVERKSRQIYIHDIKILSIDGNKILFDTTCSKGTYIRTLCSDIGKGLGSDAIMTFLLRTKTGPFDISNSITLDNLKNTILDGRLDSILYDIDFALSDYGKVYIDDNSAKKVLNGVGFFIDSNVKYVNGSLDDILLIYDNLNNFIAIGKKMNENNFVKIGKVFA